MQFSIMTVFALAAVAIASPIHMAKRQVVNNNIPANVAAMTDASGNVVPFSAQDVYVPPTRVPKTWAVAEQTPAKKVRSSGVYYGAGGSGNKTGG
ncbi:hypothetical protein TARUN_3948 [Trichoderma arundinaceum]|uniref:Uncharacterized protein n=1 Tax=Trichoderma arundinaceum TaxID=490622 RepID=A0A395NQB6_TRIAR|nr:hypothetical protein TARUN_3948 [Trichoderma arundinaceum]